MHRKRERDREVTDLEVTMSTKRLSNVTDSTSLRSKLNGLEVFDVVSIEEEVADRGSLLVDFERVTGENDTLRSDPSRVRSEEVSSSDEMNTLIGRRVETVGRCCGDSDEKGRRGSESDGKIASRDSSVNAVS